MKRVLMLFILFLPLMTMAQDVIVFRNGTTQTCKVKLSAADLESLVDKYHEKNNASGFSVEFQLPGSGNVVMNEPFSKISFVRYSNGIVVTISDEGNQGQRGNRNMGADMPDRRMQQLCRDRNMAMNDRERMFGRR